MDFVHQRRKKQNYTHHEKNILRQLISNEKILMSPKIDGPTNELKKAAWKRICNIFNRTPNCSRRHEKQLQKLWSNMKCDYRKSVTGEKKENVNSIKEKDNDSFKENSFDITNINCDIGIKTEFEIFDTKKEMSSIKSKPTNIDSESFVIIEVNDISKSEDNSTPSTSEISSSVHLKCDTDQYNTDESNIDDILNIEDESNSIMDDKTFINNDNLSRKNSRKNKITYEDVLLYKKHCMDKMDEKLEIFSIKKRALLAKERAALAKEAYFKAKLRRMMYG